MNSLALAASRLEPLLIEPEVADRFAAEVIRVADCAAGERDRLLEMLRREPGSPRVVGSTLVVPISGILGTSFSPLEAMLGGYDVNSFADYISEAGRDKAVRRVVLDVNSPGGSAGGVEEAAAAVRELAGEKKVVAYVGPGAVAGSGAYWISSQATEVVVAPSAKVGSVGAFVAWINRAEQMKQAGLKVEVVRSGKHKAGLLPGVDVSDEERALLQSSVDAIGSRFRRSVKSVRKTIKDEDLEGQVFDGREAIAKGFATGTANSLGALLGRLEKGLR